MHSHISQRLRDFPIPREVSGDCENLCKDVVRPLFAISTSVTVICRSLDPADVARMTCGMGPLLRENTTLTLLILLDPDSVIDPVKVHQAWASLMGAPVVRRLSAFRFFAASGRLRLVVRNISDVQFKYLTRSIGIESKGLLLFQDTAESAVELLWRQPLNFQELADVAAELRWSFGDPTRHVTRLKRDIHSVTADAEARGHSEIETTLLELIDALPFPELPWQESFERSVSLPVQLFPHQQSAIDAWFTNACRGIFAFCTGAGKTIASLAAVWRYAEKARTENAALLPVVVTVPTRVLADQWCREIEKFGFEPPLKAYNTVNSWHPYLRAMLRSRTDAKPAFVVSTYSTFASAAFVSLITKLEREGNRAIWIADEMHNLASVRLLDQMAKVGGYFTVRLGLSATPQIENDETKTRRLFEFFDERKPQTCGHYELADGIRDGVLCHYRYQPFPQYLQPSNSDRLMAVLDALELQQRSGRVDIDLYRQKRDIVRTSGVQIEAFQRLLATLLRAGSSHLSHTLVYCPPGYGSSRSEIDPGESDDSADEREGDRLLTEVISILRSHNITVASILGETPQAERAAILRDFRSGDIQVLCAVACLDEGIDIPDIRRAVVLYSVDREKQFIQRRGRILRRHPLDAAKVAEIHDVLILPQGSSLPTARAEELLGRELRRYRHFAALADNRTEADELIGHAMLTAVEAEKTLVQV